MSQKTVKISANLPEEAFELLKTLAYNRQTTMTEVLRSAINHESFFSEVVQKEGKVLTEDKNGQMRQILLK